jgi:anti-sigma factor RsiW
MDCERTGTVLQAYFDNELDALGAADFEQHLTRCTECTEGLAAMKSLRSSLNSARLYEKTPVTLQAKVLADLGSTRRVARIPLPNAWRWLAIAAALLLFAYTGWRFVSSRPGTNYQTELAALVVDAHLRSLQPGHLTDVISTDQHTVKPWFDGKLNFAPPVRDFAEQGFPLQGGRLDVIHGRTIAALVYGRRKHVVNVFIWPTGELDASVHEGSQQGYNWVDWRKNGMEFCAVSDISPTELSQLQKLFVEQ